MKTANGSLPKNTLQVNTIAQLRQRNWNDVEIST